jgi:hypothetical protein
LAFFCDFQPAKCLICAVQWHRGHYGAQILKHFKVTAEKIALGKVNFSSGILKQPDFSLTAVCHCGQETYSLATGLNAAVLVTLLESVNRKNGNWRFTYKNR